MATINRFVTLLFLLFAVMGALMLQGCGKEEEKAPAGADADQGGGGGGDTEIEEDQPKKNKKKGKRKKGALSVDADDDELGGYDIDRTGQGKKAKKRRKETRNLANSKNKGAALKKGAQTTKLKVPDEEGYGDDVTSHARAVSEDDAESDQDKLQQLQDEYSDASADRTSQQAYANSHEDLSQDAEIQVERADAAEKAAAHTKMKRDAKNRRQRHAKNSEFN